MPLLRPLALLLTVALAWSFTAHTAVAAGPTPVNLGMAGSFVILTKTGITNVPTSAITGNIGASPITAAAMDNVTCAEITGKIYGANTAYTGSGDTTCFKGAAADNTLVANAVLDMGTAYADAAGRTTPDFTELYAGDISGQTLVPGLYKWGTGVLISSDVTLSGGPNDVWIFQVAGNVTQASASHILLAGGARPQNIFWQVAGGAGVAMGTTAHFEGVILAATGVTLTSGATVNGRLLAQTAVTLIQNTVTQPAAAPAFAALVGLPDLNGNGGMDMAVLRLSAGSIVAEIRDGQSGALLKNITFLTNAFTPVSTAALPDADGNGISELAVLATRNSDGRVIAEIRNVSGVQLPRHMWFPAGFSPVAMKVIAAGAANIGVPALAVLLSRDLDGRGLVEVTNAFGAANTQFMWSAAGYTVTNLAVVNDGTGVPAIAMLSTMRASEFRVESIAIAGSPVPSLTTAR